MTFIGLALAGFVFGLGYFHSLRGVVGLHVRGRALKAIALQLVRVVIAAAFFVMIARAGFAPLLTSFLGFLASRSIVLHRAKERG